MSFISKGEVEFRLDKDNPKKIIFVKSLGQQSPKEDEFPPEEQYPEPEAPPMVGSRQDSIKAQFCVREGLKMIEVNNQIQDAKIIPTMPNIRSNAIMVWRLIDELANGI